MKKHLLIVFVKNILLGKVKTRLAKTVGDWGAFEVYKELVDITEKESCKVDFADRHIYFSDIIIDSKWPDDQKFVQKGANLGERMKSAFQHGFDRGYERIVGIGSDLPDLNAKVMQEGFRALEQSDTVFGPAQDGGYYLLGMNQLIPEIFDNKPWSKENLLDTTKGSLEQIGKSVHLLETLNDIDNIEDLKSSSVAHKFEHLYDLSRRNK